EDQAVVVADLAQGEEVADVVGGEVGEQGDLDVPLVGVQGDTVAELLAVGGGEADAVPPRLEVGEELVDGLPGDGLVGRAGGGGGRVGGGAGGAGGGLMQGVARRGGGAGRRLGRGGQFPPGRRPAGVGRRDVAHGFGVGRGGLLAAAGQAEVGDERGGDEVAQ